MTAPAAMPSEEDVALAIKRAQLGGRAELSKEGPWREHEFKPARAILDLFAPILAEKERAEFALCDLINAAGHYKATHSEIDREALSATIKAAADYVEAAAIRAQGE